MRTTSIDPARPSLPNSPSADAWKPDAYTINVSTPVKSIPALGAMAPGQLVVRQDSPEAEDKVFLSAVYSLAAVGKMAAAGDLIFRHINWLMISDRFDRCDSILDAVDLDRLDNDTSLMVSFLTITAAGSHRIRSRVKLAERIRNKMYGIRGKEYTNRLFRKIL